MTAIDNAGGKFNKINDLHWKLNIDVQKELDEGSTRIYEVNSLRLYHMSVSRWYGIISEPNTPEVYATNKFVSSDNYRIG